MNQHTDMISVSMIIIHSFYKGPSMCSHPVSDTTNHG
uniref:Uncharacterized protein n=1 Tax=Anguilla anguilla TaxID=7936 RepID=A0A0E9TFC8_ANGAN